MQGPLDRRDAAALVVLGLIGVGVPLGMVTASGGIGLPTLDDWVYMRGAEALYRTGSIEMPPRTAASIGQLVLVQPLLWLSGGRPWAFTLFGLGLTLIGIVATYLLSRRYLGTSSAVAAVLLLVVVPGFAREAASFLTDVPAFALGTMCLLLGVRWVDGGKPWALVVSVAIGILAISVREFAAAAPAAVLVAGWARRRASERVWLAGAAVLLVIGVVGVTIGSASILGRAEPSTVFLPRMLLVGPMFVTFAAVLLPALVTWFGRRLAATNAQYVLAGAALVTLAVVVRWGSSPGNLWLANGIGGGLLLSGVRENVFDDRVWELTRGIATLAAIILASIVIRRVHIGLRSIHSLSGAVAAGLRIARRRDGVLVLFLLAYAAELVAYSLVGAYDRYLLPMVPVAAILLLSSGSEPFRLTRRVAFSHAAFAWLALSAVALSANAFAYDAARWRAGEGAVNLGYAAATVDAGYEWIGYHGEVAAGTTTPVLGAVWSDGRWALPLPCAVVSNSPLSDPALALIRLDDAAYRHFLFVGPWEPLYLYGSTSADCPTPAAVAP